MNTESRQITISGMPVEVIRKDIKNLHLGVYPPNGRVRVAAPFRMGDEAIRLAIISRLGWIKRQQARFAAQPRESRREMVNGESHYFLGRRYRLNVEERPGNPCVTLHGKRMTMRVPPGYTTEQREGVLARWYRRELKKLVPPLLTQWAPVIGVEVADWGVKRMKTMWGACNQQARRIWLNLELAKKPARCLEYIVVHELVHLRERHHEERFVSLMNQYLPQWRARRQELNAAPLANETWGY